MGSCTYVLFDFQQCALNFLQGASVQLTDRINRIQISPTAAVISEAEKLKAQDYDLYMNVWEGQCLQMLEGVVYAKELRAAQQENRICNVPWDRETPANIWLDRGAGKSDKTAIWIGQRVAMQNRMLHYYENNMSDTLHYAKYLKDLPYTYDVIWLPHDAKAKKIGMKLTIEEQFRAHFPSCSVRVVPKLSLADGVNAARLVLPNTFFDEDECEEKGDDRSSHVVHLLVLKVDGHSLAPSREANVNAGWRFPARGVHASSRDLS